MEDALQVFHDCPSEFTTLTAWLHACPRRCHLQIREYRRQCLRRRQEHFDVTRRHAQWLHTLHESGGISFHVPFGEGAAQHVCEQCGMECGSKAALAAHRSKTHGEIAAAATINRTCCFCCGMEYWTTPRLRLHLRKRESCLASHLESDIDFAQWEFCNHPVDGRRPAQRIPSAKPFWATLQPFRAAQDQAVLAHPSVMLRRCLRHGDLCIVFRHLVLLGVAQRLGSDAYDQLRADVQAELVSGAPGIAQGPLCSILGLARSIVGAALSDGELQCTAGSHEATLFSGRCTLFRK